MASDEQATSATRCKSVAEQLKDVKDAINEFESRKLGELKTALENFLKDQDKTVRDYSDKYQNLKDRWWQQQREIEALYTSIKTCFPDPNAKRLKDCICGPALKIAELDKKIADRKKECFPCEGPRDHAQAAHDKANAQLTALVKLVTQLDEALTKNGGKEGENGKGGLIKTIRENLAKPEMRTVAFYDFWFTLLTLHRSIQPDDAGDPKPPLLKDYCKPKADQTTGDIWRDTSGTADEQAEASSPCAELDKAPLPRLVAPSKYRELLDLAFCCFNDTKSRLAKAESALKRKKDELDGWVAERTERTKNKEQDITSCLKGLKPGDPCSPETDSPATGA